MTVAPERLAAFLQPYQETWSEFSEDRARGDAVPWVLTCMRTRDEDAGAAGLPSELLSVPDKPHIRLFTWAWYSIRLLELDKSRQLMITWLACGLTVHEAMFSPSAKIGYQHMTGADTAEKIEYYMLYVLEAQPLSLMLPWVEERDHPPLEWVHLVAAELGLSMEPPGNPRADQPTYYNSEAYSVAKKLTNRYQKSSSAEGIVELRCTPFFELEADRVIEAIPAGSSGPQKWRGSTRSRAVQDEAWFHQRLAQNISSAVASVGQNGRQTMFSTANRGEDGDDYPLTLIKKHPKQPEWFGGFHGAVKKRKEDMPFGCEIWLTEMGYTHIRIWYYADVDKRGPDWFEKNIMTGDRREKNREYLIMYDQTAGEPFYEVFNPENQRLEELYPVPAARYLVGMDGGRKPAAVLIEVHPNGRVIPVAEIVTPHDRTSNAQIMADRMETEWGMRFPGWSREAILVLDPSMFDTRSETDDNTAALIFQNKGWYVVKGAMEREPRYRAVQKLCLENVNDAYNGGKSTPKLQVLAPACPALFAALSGGCSVAKNNDGGYSKEKNHSSHVVEAFEYPASYLSGMHDLGVSRFRPKRHRTKNHRAA